MPITNAKLLAPVDVLVDSREASKNKDLVEKIRSKGIKVAIVSLEVGDYFLLATEGKKPVIVERKTVIDLANSIRDNRIWDQAKLLREAAIRENAQPLIVVEGSFYSLTRFTKWNLTSILRVMDELVLKMNIPILPTPNKEATAEWIAAKARSLGATAKKTVIRMRVEKKPMSLNDRILYVAEGIVGPILAKRLLSYFKTLRNLANASISELTKIEGIGEKRAKEIYAIFNTPWNPD